MAVIFADYGMIQVFFTLQMVVKSQNAIKCIIFCEKMWRVWAKQALILESAPQNDQEMSFGFHSVNVMQGGVITLVYKDQNDNDMLFMLNLCNYHFSKGWKTLI